MIKLLVVLLCLVLFACKDNGLNHQSHKIAIESFSLSATSGEQGIVESTLNDGEHSVRWEVSTEKPDNRYLASLYLSLDNVLEPVDDLKLFGSNYCSPSHGNLNTDYCSTSILSCNYSHEMILDCAFTSGDFQRGFSKSLIKAVEASKPAYYILKACHYESYDVCVTKSVKVTFM